MKVVALVVLVAVVAGAGIARVFSIWQARPDSPFAGVPLVDQSGRRFTLDRFTGKRLLVGFATASEGASGACASIAGKFAYLQRRIDPARMHLLEVSADPVNDSLSGVLHAYARAYGIDEARWTVATGTVADLSPADAAFIRDAQAARVPDVFGEAVAVIDERGHLRAVLDAAAVTPDELVRKALAY